ncbi:MAG: hydrogenase nickel incorporation protein HypA [Thermoplasmata archaeon]
MHEWSLAKGVMDTVIDEIERNNAEGVKNVEILVGEISQIDIETFKYALESITKGTPFENTKFDIKIERSELKCRNCGHIWNFEESKDELIPLSEDGDNALHYLPESVSIFISCPVCHSHDIEILGGRGVRIKKLILEVKD